MSGKGFLVTTKKGVLQPSCSGTRNHQHATTGETHAENMSASGATSPQEICVKLGDLALFPNSGSFPGGPFDGLVNSASISTLSGSIFGRGFPSLPIFGFDLYLPVERSVGSAPGIGRLSGLLQVVSGRPSLGSHQLGGLFRQLEGAVRKWHLIRCAPVFRKSPSLVRTSGWSLDSLVEHRWWFKFGSHSRGICGFRRTS